MGLDPPPYNVVTPCKHVGSCGASHSFDTSPFWRSLSLSLLRTCVRLHPACVVSLRRRSRRRELRATVLGAQL